MHDDPYTYQPVPVQRRNLTSCVRQHASQCAVVLTHVVTVLAWECTSSRDLNTTARLTISRPHFALRSIELQGPSGRGAPARRVVRILAHREDRLRVVVNEAEHLRRARIACRAARGQRARGVACVRGGNGGGGHHRDEDRERVRGLDLPRDVERDEGGAQPRGEEGEEADAEVLRRGVQQRDRDPMAPAGSDGWRARARVAGRARNRGSTWPHQHEPNSPKRMHTAPSISSQGGSVEPSAHRMMVNM